MRSDRKRIGLVLSGGAVRGGAHVGVLKTLERAQVPVDAVVGTSVGAMIGAAVAAGWSGSQLETLILDQKWSRLVRPSVHLKTALFDTTPICRLLREEVLVERFEQLKIPFAAVCCDIATGEVVTRNAGDLVGAVLASSAVPGLFPAHELDGRLLVDGGIVNNLPVDIARAMEVDVVLAVDLLEPLNKHLVQPPRDLFEIWQRSLYFMIQRSHPDVSNADVTIVPPIADFSFTKFEDIPELIRCGEDAAEAALPKILGLLHEPKTITREY